MSQTVDTPRAEITTEFLDAIIGLKSSESARPSSHVSTMPLAALDICCGMGGLSVAARDLNVRILAGLDLNPNALRTFAKNFPSSAILAGSIGDESTVEKALELAQQANESGERLIVISGPPCQGFSLAGRRDPKDPRNDVLLDVVMAIERIQPWAALIENVPPLLEPKHEDRLNLAKGILQRGGYCSLPVLLDAADYGVPQNRKRAFILVTRHELTAENVMLFLHKMKLPKVTVQAALAGLPSPVPRPEKYSDDDDCPELPNHFSMRHSDAVIGKIAKIAPGTGPMSYRRLNPVRQSNTLFSGHRAPPAHYSEPRSITVREAARLQGFPDSFRVYGTFGNQMEQVTNAVPPPLARAALRALIHLGCLGAMRDGS